MNKAIPEGGRWVKCARCAEAWHLRSEDGIPASSLNTSRLHAPILMSETAEEAQVHHDALVAPSQSSREQHETVAEAAAREKNMHDDEKRVALVVGNGKYQKTSWLANPPNDADKMGAALGRLGFEVLDGTNLDYGNFAKRVRDFGRALREAHVALFFYAGHGLQVRGENYVVPVDAALEHEADVQLELIAVQTILASMEIGNRTSIVILDACRDNPLARNLARATGTTRSAAIGDGLGRLESGIGTYIAFATAPNKLALDGDNAPNSPFTAALLRHIETPGLTIADVMMQVRRDVIAATEKMREGPQVPWDNSSLTAPFYFKRPVTSGPQQPVPPDPAIITDRAERDWQRLEIAETEDVRIIEAYISQYRTSDPLWAARARQQLELVRALIADRAEQERVQKAAEARRRQEEDDRKADIIRVRVGTGGGKDEERRIAPGSGERFKDFAEGPEMVIVPSGEFMMGSTDDEISTHTKEYGDYFKQECPRHRVVIPQPFAIGRYAVTFAEWDAFVAAVGGTSRPGDQGWGRGDRPVIKVSWNDIRAYLVWLRLVTNKDYRLPSEAEWEYAARAGTQTPFWWGASINPEQANYDSNSTYGGGPTGAHRKITLPVNNLGPNPWGLYQVHGNVWEWVEDGWHDSYADKPEAIKANGGVWRTITAGSPHIVRGGSWFAFPRELRSAARDSGATNLRDLNVGFRLARSLSPL